MTLEFRAWDKINKVYDVPTQIDIDDSGHIIVVDTYHGSIVDGDFILEQYTGLKDVNENKIFEGDIVKMDRHGYNQPGIYEVRYFIQGKCVFQKVEVTDGSTMFQEASNGHDLTVIGNINENPELLEVDE